MKDAMRICSKCKTNESNGSYCKPCKREYERNRKRLPAASCSGCRRTVQDGAVMSAHNSYCKECWREYIAQYRGRKRA